MRNCPFCLEQFDDKFNYCPVDGTPLDGPPVAAAEQSAAAAPARSDTRDECGEYQLTFLDDEGPVRRLVKKLMPGRREAGLTWPEFKRDPARPSDVGARPRERILRRAFEAWRCLAKAWPGFRRGEGGHDRTLKESGRFYLNRTVALGLEAGHVYAWVKLEHAIEQTLGVYRGTPFCIGARVLVALLILVNILAILSFEIRHLWRLARPVNEGGAPEKEAAGAAIVQTEAGHPPQAGAGGRGLSGRTSRRRVGYARVPLRVAPSRWRRRYV